MKCKKMEYQLFFICKPQDFFLRMCMFCKLWFLVVRVNCPNKLKEYSVFLLTSIYFERDWLEHSSIFSILTKNSKVKFELEALLILTHFNSKGIFKFKLSCQKEREKQCKSIVETNDDFRPIDHGQCCAEYSFAIRKTKALF